MAKLESQLQAVKMDPLKDLGSRVEQKVNRAWEMLAEGWRYLLSRGGGALTHFDRPAEPDSSATPRQDFPHWSLLAGEIWETAQSVIIRIEVPGVRKEDLDVSIHGAVLVVRGVKRSEDEHGRRRYSLMERAYGKFERTVPITHEVDRERSEVSYQDGVITVILPKIEATPPRQLTVS